MALSPVPSSSESLDVGATAVGFTSAPARATFAQCQVLNANVRYWVDGSTPTASEGFQAVTNALIKLRGKNEIANFKAVAEADGASLQCGFWQGVADSSDGGD